MTDDNITSLHPKPRLATVTHEVPSRSGNLHVPADEVDADVLARFGLDPGAWPPAECTTVLPTQTLRELRRRAIAAEHHAWLVHTEYEKLVRHLSDLIGDDTGGAA
jgi:hypothetical protein